MAWVTLAGLPRLEHPAAVVAVGAAVVLLVLRVHQRQVAPEVMALPEPAVLEVLREAVMASLVARVQGEAGPADRSAVPLPAVPAAMTTIMAVVAVVALIMAAVALLETAARLEAAGPEAALTYPSEDTV